MEVVKYLINERGCNPECRGRIGQTPLHSACRNVKYDMDYLIGECNVDASTQDDLGNTPLHSAAKSGEKSVVGLLLTKFDYDLEVVNNKGKTPSEEALKMGHKHILEHLKRVKEIRSSK